MSDALEQNINHPEKYFNQKEYISSTFDQLKKDLGSIMPEEIDELPSMSSMDELKEFFKPLFESLLAKRRHELVQVLYRVDLGESKTAKILEGQLGSDISEILTAEILNRELKKVIIRKHYSADS